ncbi:class I SAM-dependent methyltransferase [Maridesulfovibrio salexigens]|uniref:Methyltransferase type 11 n=1 Tax=Maridesulfovibrio salexigens (strain ATCC 14822 / DSM 2638 / NCIMB 8403 / VKM B-1763) TaxID=526222 RepID=C6BTX8_MARSD|nr:class I SAM-dependent methyltransferase [Maridesulfovibrio salexigens]ACS81687.1 Methyltransferase type 11 [Maridesulfovibrio salexigens DSM 2638]
MIKYRELEDLLNEYAGKNSSVLEIGSRPGCYAFAHHSVIHIESNIENLKGLDLLTTGSSLPFKNESFDMIFMVAVDYYVEDHEAMLAECQRVLKKGGRLIIATYKQENLAHQVATQDEAWHAFSEDEYAARYKKAGFNNFVIDKIINNPPQNPLKRAVWHFIPRGVLMLRSQWRIYSGIKI